MGKQSRSHLTPRAARGKGVGACRGVPRVRVLCGLAPLACGVLLMVALTPPEALASTNSAIGVEAPLPADAGTNPNVVVYSVSCASAGNCTAVGGYDFTSSNERGLLLSEMSGTWATGVEASLPANARTNPFLQLGSVSCASAGNCTAVGSYFDSSGREQGVVFTETSGTWATGVEPSLPANAGTNPSGSVYSVSCASAGNCTAIGGYTDSSGHSQGLLLTETSGTWATGVEASLPANANTNPDVSLDSVSCASAGNCTAVGNYNDSYDNSTVQDQGLLLTETSGTWATGVDASLPAGAGTALYVNVQRVSCASAGNCTAVGGYEDSSFNRHGLLWTETSGTWAPGVEAPLPANANNTGAGLANISCASAGNCTAVGSYQDSSGDGQGLLLSEMSGTWATGVEASLPANAGTNPDAYLGSVTCASAGNCTAVGSYTDSSGHQQGLVLTETSGTWGLGVEASLPANAGTNPDATLDSVSCVSAGNCTAVGEYEDSSGHEQGLLLGGSTASVSALKLIGRPTSKNARVIDKLICMRSAPGPCHATETLTTTETTRGGRPVALSASSRRKRRTVSVATKKVTIQPGKKVTVTVKLNATGRKLLARFGKLPVTLKVTLLQNGRHLAIANTKLTVKPKKK